MSDHPREHEELLSDLLVGERRSDEPEVERRLRECARCRAEWALLQDATANLARVGAERRAALVEIERSASAVGEERVRATLERLAHEEALGRRRPRRALAWLAAAALLVAGAWIARRFSTRESPGHDPAWLGPGLVHLVAPRGEVPRFEAFSWTYTGAGAARFTLRIHELVDGRQGELLIERQRLEDTTWTPDAQDLERLSTRIRWEVEAFDEFRVSQGSDSAQAWLSSR